MSCLLSSMPLSTYARNRYLYTYHRFAYLNHRVHSSLLQSIKIAVMKKIIRLKFFKLFNCLQNDFGGNSCMFHCPWCGVHAWGPSSNPSRNQLSISLTLTKWRRVKSGQHTIYQCIKFIGWEGSHSERLRDRSLHWCTNTYWPTNDWLVLK